MQSTVITPFLQKRNLRLRFLNVIKSHSWQVAEPEFQAKCLALESLRFLSARLCLAQWFSKCGPQINSSITAGELVRNTHHWPTPHRPNKERWGWVPGLLFNKPRGDSAVLKFMKHWSRPGIMIRYICKMVYILCTLYSFTFLPLQQSTESGSEHISILQMKKQMWKMNMTRLKPRSSDTNSRNFHYIPAAWHCHELWNTVTALRTVYSVIGKMKQCRKDHEPCE